MQRRPWVQPLVALVVVGALFQFAHPMFLSPQNLTNLLQQAAALCIMACGLVLVLLLGEMDLAAGSVSGLCAAVMAVLMARGNVPGPAAVGAALLLGAAVGALHGAWVTALRVPSFMVTLAGWMAWQGVMLWVLGATGTLHVQDPFVVGLANTFLPATVAWALAALVMVATALVYARQGHLVHAWPWWAGSVGLAVLAQADRGLPVGVLLVALVVSALHVMLTRTRLGRHVLAVGQNAEAAHRANIRVRHVRVLMFVGAGVLAACSGVLASSRLLSVGQSSGSGDLLLHAVAAAVIGGTRLSGGAGSMPGAVLGALVIASISNGMDLLGLPSAVKFVVTGGALLVAISLDVAWWARLRRAR